MLLSLASKLPHRWCASFLLSIVLHCWSRVWKFPLEFKQLRVIQICIVKSPLRLIAHREHIAWSREMRLHASACFIKSSSTFLSMLVWTTSLSDHWVRDMSNGADWIFNVFIVFQTLSELRSLLGLILIEWALSRDLELLLMLWGISPTFQ